MAGSPRVVTADVSFTWDGVPWRLQRGQVIDVPPGSPLEEAIGADMLVPMYGAKPAATAPQPVQEPEAAQEPEEPAEATAQDDTAPAASKASSAAKTGKAASPPDKGGGEAT